jgi:prepilin-type N-terminal cleavage/methylation domain-containing protein
MKGKSRGFTLLETIVVVALGVVIVGAAGPALFQVMTGSERSNNRVTAVLQVQRAGYWISNDALKSQKTVTTAGNGFPLELAWSQTWPEQGQHGVDYVSTEHTVTYSLEGDELQRQEHLKTTTYDASGQLLDSIVSDATTPVAQYLTAATQASFTSGVLTVSVAARFPLNGGRYIAEETRVYEVRPRLQQ